MQLTAFLRIHLQKSVAYLLIYLLKGSLPWQGLIVKRKEEKYLKVFLTNGNVPMDNNATEQAIRGFCIVRQN